MTGTPFIEFEIPGLPVTYNAGNRAHWAAKTRAARYWKGAVFLAARSAFRGRGWPPRWEKVRLTLTRFSSQEPDFDGLVSSFKPVIDGLVSSEVITNDKPSNVGSPTYRWEYAPPNRGRIRVLVEKDLAA